MLYRPIFKTPSSTFQHKLRLYTACIRPILLYGSPIYVANKGSIKCLETVQNKLLRHISDQPYLVKNKIINNLLSIPPLQMSFNV